MRAPLRPALCSDFAHRMDGHCSRDLGRPGLGGWVGITAIKVIPERRSLLWIRLLLPCEDRLLLV